MAKPRSPFLPERPGRGLVVACTLLEWLFLAYLGFLNFLIIILPRRIEHAPRFFFLHLGVAAAILALVWARERWNVASLRFARHWYPLALFVFFFEEFRYLVHLIFPGWFDAWLVQFDYSLFGAHPTVWLERFVAPASSELMSLAYLTYYFYTVVLAGILYGRGELRAFWRVMTATAAAYVMSYVIAILFPVEGPFHTLAALQRATVAGGGFTRLVKLVQSVGSVHGAAFPSLHVAGAFVALLGAWQYRRWLFWVFLPFFCPMLVSAVYLRYHYAADVFGGLLVGAIGFFARQISGGRR